MREGLFRGIQFAAWETHPALRNDLRKLGLMVSWQNDFLIPAGIADVAALGGVGAVDVDIDCVVGAVVDAGIVAVAGLVAVAGRVLVSWHNGLRRPFDFSVVGVFVAAVAVVLN